MGAFRNWLKLNEDANVQSGLRVGSGGEPTAPTNAAQNSAQIAGTALQNKGNMDDISKITQAHGQGRGSQVKNMITKMSQTAINEFPGQAQKRNVALAPVGDQIEKSLGFDKYFKGMKKEDVAAVPPFFAKPKDLSPVKEFKVAAKEFKPITKGTSVGRAMSAAKSTSMVKPPAPPRMTS